MRSRRSRASRARPRLRSRTRSWQDLRSRKRNDEAPNRTSLVDEARLASVLCLSDGHIGRYRSTSRDDQRRPSALFAARASFTPSASVELFLPWPSMYADSMLTFALPRRFAARASVPGLLARRTSTTLRSLEIRYLFFLMARRAFAASLSSTTMWTIPAPPPVVAAMLFMLIPASPRAPASAPS